MHHIDRTASHVDIIAKVSCTSLLWFL
uniref:Uncharacterized protein n=1 Tax=Anguilla anguilla TaxID=7936 RepID=A0A0E9SLR8_ANGAN